MTRLDYRRHEPERRPTPKPWRRYPVWLGYVSIFASAIQALGYLGMVFLYNFSADKTQTQEEAGTFSITIAGLCIIWSVYLFYIGTAMTTGDSAPRSRLLVWGGVQVAASILLAMASGYERYSHVNAGGPAAADLTERAVANAVGVGVFSAAYAICALWYELAILTKPAGQFPSRR